MASEKYSFLSGLDPLKIDLSLDRIKEFLEKTGSPHKKCRFVHVTGTNGKGSTSTFVSSALKEAGFKTGLYLSPHLVNFRERISVNGEWIPEQELIKLGTALKSKKDELKIKLTFFEFVTAIAFHYFAEKECDFVVLETGMGGRLDATNVVTPELSVVTKIGIEHSAYLGETLARISFEKAGIIKKGVPIISAEQHSEALKVIERKCSETDSKLYLQNRDFEFKNSIIKKEKQSFDFFSDGTELKGLETKLRGEFQFENASLAVKAMQLLELNNEAIRSGLLKAELKGRMQVIHNNPFIVLDVAHNPLSALALKESIQKIYSNESFLVVLGVSGDKDAKKIVRELMPVAKSFVCVQAQFRGMEPEKLRDALKLEGFTGKIDVFKKVSDGLRFAMGSSSRILVTGSFFSVGEAMRFLEFSNRT